MKPYFYISTKKRSILFDLIHWYTHEYGMIFASDSEDAETYLAIKLDFDFDTLTLYSDENHWQLGLAENGLRLQRS